MFIPKHLIPRQSDGSSSCNCISGGAIAGIVIGTIVGTLLILWLILSFRATTAMPVDDYPKGREHRSSSHRERRPSQTVYVDNVEKYRARDSSRRGGSGSRHYVDDTGKSYRITQPAKAYYQAD